MDNTSALSYISRFGSIQCPWLASISRDIWECCEIRNIYLYGSYISSCDNYIADEESRRLDSNTEWSLSKDAFALVSRTYFGRFNIDLFASSINFKCKQYVSWLSHPGSLYIDAFTISWTNYYFYAFPPFILIPRVLRKIIDDSAEGVVIVPLWPSQSWFPLFKKFLISKLITLKPSFNLLSSPFREAHPSLKTLSLVAGKLSAKHLH